MFLRDIEIYILPLSNDVNALGATARCVEDIFLKELGRISSNKIAKINIYLTEEYSSDIKNNTVSVLNIYVPFSFQKFSAISVDNLKKQVVAEAIFRGLNAAFDGQISILTALSDVYQRIIDKKIENISIYKDKSFYNKQKVFYARIIITFNINNYQIISKIFNKDNVLLGSKINFQHNNKVFDIEKVYWESEDIFCIKFKGPQKIFRTTIDEIINGKPPVINQHLSDWFKEKS